MGRMTAGLMAAALVATPLAAQEHPMGPPGDTTRMGVMRPGGTMGMMGMMHGSGPGVMGMMSGHMMGGAMMGLAGGPAMMLRLEETLELTERQVEQLEPLRDSATAAMRQHMMQGMQSVRSAGELLASASPDMEAYEARLREAADHMVQGHLVQARSAAAAREILSPEQRERLDLVRTLLREMREGMGAGSMMEGMMPGTSDPEGAGPHHP